MTPISWLTLLSVNLLALQSCGVKPPKVESRRLDIYPLGDQYTLKDVRFAGDMDGDSYGDMVVLAYEAATQKTFLELVSGKSKNIAAKLEYLDSKDGRVEFGEKSLASLMAPGDLSFDGYADIVYLGVPIYGGVPETDGLFSLFRTLGLPPENEKQKLDMDSDRYPDTLYSEVVWDADAAKDAAPSKNMLHAISATKSQIRARNQDLGLNHAAALVGDLNGDSTADMVLLVIDSTDKNAKKRIVALNGGNNTVKFTKADQLIYQKPITLAIDGNTNTPTIISADDLNNDNVPDFFVADRLQKQENSSEQSHIYAFSGLDGSLLYQITSEAGEIFGELSKNQADYDGDKISDLLVPVRVDAKGSDAAGNDIQIRSGRDGYLLDHFYFSRDLLLGAKTGFGDVDRDGFADMIVANGDTYFTVLYGNE